MKEAILIEEAVKHACIDLLVFLHFGVAESLHGLNELSNLLINLGGLGLKDFFEIVIRSVVNLLGALSSGELVREVFTKLHNAFSDLILCLRLDQGILIVLEVL